MKEAGTDHWLAPNTGATNVSGFNALGAGNRNPNGYVYSLGINCYFSTSSLGDGLNPWVRGLYNSSDDISHFISESLGYGASMRCLKDD